MSEESDPPQAPPDASPPTPKPTPVTPPNEPMQMVERPTMDQQTFSEKPPLKSLLRLRGRREKK
jgi:hypothetical protein